MKCDGCRVISSSCSQKAQPRFVRLDSIICVIRSLRGVLTPIRSISRSRRSTEIDMRASAFVRTSVVLSTAGFVCWLGGIRLNLTGSMPVGVYRVVHGKPARGAMVLACLPASVAAFAHDRGYVPNGNCPGGVAAVGKLILALAGDTVVVTTAGLEVASRLEPNSKPLQRDSQGRPLPQLALGAYVVQ